MTDWATRATVACRRALPHPSTTTARAVAAAAATVLAIACVDAQAEAERHCVTTLEAHERAVDRDASRPASAPTPRPCPTLLARDVDVAIGTMSRTPSPSTVSNAIVAHG